MPVANVSVVAGSDGKYAYICGEECLWRFFWKTSNKPVRTRLRTSDAHPDADRPVQVLTDPRVGRPAGRHVFYRRPRTDEIWYAFDAAPAGAEGTLDVRQLRVDGDPTPMMKTFGAVAVTDGVLLIGADPTQQNALRVVALPWAALDPATWMEGATTNVLSLPLSDGSRAGRFDTDDAEVTCDMLLSASGADPVVVIAAKRRRDHDWQLGCWLAPLGDELVLGDLTEHPTRWEHAAIRFPKVQVLPDFSAVLFFIDESGTVRRFTNTPLGLTGLPAGSDGQRPVPPSGWQTGEQGDRLAFLDTMSRGRTPGVHTDGNAFQVVMTPGTPVTGPSPLNPELTDAVVPMHTELVHYVGNGQVETSRDERNVWAELVRTGRPVVRGGRKTLLGIIEGPPPIPQENLNIPDRLDPLRYFNGPGYAQVTFSQSRESTSEMELDWSAAVVVKTSAEFEVGGAIPWLTSAKAFLTISGSVSNAYQAAYTTLSSDQSVSSVVAGSEIQGSGCPGDLFRVQPAGTLVCQGADWTGYEYSYRDPGSQEPTTGTSIFQIEPTNVSLELLPYPINPASGPTPGVLDSYRLTDEQRNALERSSRIEVGHGTGYLTAGWTYNAKAVPSFGTVSKTGTTHGFRTEAEVEVSGGGSVAALFGSGKWTAGVAFKGSMSGAWTTTTGSGLEISSEVWVRGNVDALDAYTSYSYRIYLLDGDRKWADELLADLVTETFPRPPDERREQQKLHDMIDPDSRPWKICYALDGATFNPARPAPVPTSGQVTGAAAG